MENYGPSRSRGLGCGRDHDRGRSNYIFRGNNHSYFKKTTNDDHRGKTPQNKSFKSSENQCFRCSINGHWTHIYRTPKHLVDLYQALLKEMMEKKH